MEAEQDKDQQQHSPLKLSQCFSNPHGVPITVLSFSYEGAFLASAGSDGSINIWRVLQFDKEEHDQFDVQTTICESTQVVPEGPLVFSKNAFQRFLGHEREITGLSWSLSQFLLSSSMDSTVRLWHVQRNMCL